MQQSVTPIDFYSCTHIQDLQLCGHDNLTRPRAQAEISKLWAQEWKGES